MKKKPTSEVIYEMSNKQKIDSLIVATLIGIQPVFMLSVGYTSTIFYILSFVCLTLCFSRKGGITATIDDWLRYKWLGICLSFSIFVVLMVAIVDQRMLGSALERSVRVCFGLLFVLSACLSLEPRSLRQSVWGIGLSSFFSAVISFWLAWPDFSRPDVPEYNAVSYGNLALLTSVITILSLGWKLTKHQKIEISLKLIIITSGIFGFILTQTRSGWVAVPFFIFIGMLLIKNNYSIQRLMGIFISLIFIAFVAFASSKTLVDRAHNAAEEINECIVQPLSNTSICIRLQLWRASWEMFKQDPFLGIGGADRFGEELKLLSEKNIVSKFIIDEGFEEPHNDIFYAMASYGSLGLISILLLYIAPGWIFAKRLLSRESMNLRVAAAMGLTVCVGFFIFGITELMFRGMRTMGFYAVTIAWLLALSDRIFLKRDLS